MKYIKTYENEETKEYYINDYIILRKDVWTVEQMAKIIDKYIPSMLKGEYRYQIETYKLINNQYIKFWVDFYEIERKLTPKEIKEYKLKLNVNKYNL